jgi:Tol biopolymer transport system component
MKPSRPGRPGALAAVLSVLLAALPGGSAGADPGPLAPILAAVPSRLPAGATAISALADLIRPRIGPDTSAAALDPPGPDTPGVTSLVSTWIPSSSRVAGFPSTEPAISADGRYIAYSSTATTIVPSGADDGFAHVYEFDRATGINRLISASTILVDGKPEQLPRGSNAIEPTVDADGSLIAYVVTIPAVVGAAVVPGGSFVVVHDNAADSDVELAPGDQPSISGDGQLVALDSTTALDPALDSNKVADVYVVSRATDTTTLASVGANGRAPAQASTGPSLSADGLFVAFTSAARLVTLDHDPASDVYVRDLTVSKTSLASVHAGTDSGASSGASISADGRYVAFSSVAATLAPGARAGGSLADLYVRDLVAHKTVRLSRAIGGGGSDGASSAAGMSADGRTIAFSSTADNLVPSDTNHGADVFIVDRASGRITRASITSADGQAAPASGAPGLSSNGSVLAFASTGHDLAAGAHGGSDVYARLRLPKAAVSPPALAFAARPAGSSSPAQLVSVLSVGAGPLVVSSVALGGANPGAFAIVADGCTGSTLEHGEACAIGVAFQPAIAGTSLATLVVTDNDPTGSQSVALSGGTLKPTIVLDPPIGPPGFVTTAIGANFPPGATVSVVWSMGLTASMPVVVAGPSGSFSVPMLILPRDTLGPRILTGTFTAAGGGSVASPPFLVVPGSSQPPFNPARIPGQPEGPVFRR